jgi:DNA-binding beta-propeller fold protein YncE
VNTPVPPADVHAVPSPLPDPQRRALLALPGLTLVLGLAGCAAAGPAAAPAGTLVVLNKSDATAQLIDLAIGRELARLPVGQGPHEVAVSPDGRRAVVSNYGNVIAGHTLSVLDLAQVRVRGTVVLGPLSRPHGVQFIDARRVIVTAQGQAAALVVDIERGEVLQTLVTGQRVAHMVAVAPGGQRAFVANIGSNNLTVLDLAAGTVLGHIPTGAGAEGVDVTPDGAEVWVSNRAADTITVLDTRRLEAVATLPAPGFPIRVRFDPAGERAYVTVPRDDAVLVFDRRSRALLQRIALPGGAVSTEGRLLGEAFGRSSVPIGVVTDGRGRRLFVAQSHADQVAEFDAASGRLLRRLPTGREPDGLAWSPLRLPVPR